MSFAVLALDPGGSTGWASMIAEAVPAENGKYELFNPSYRCGQIESKEHHKKLYTLMGLFHTDLYYIVSESFEYRNKSRPGLELVSREYIGVTKYFCQERDVPLFMQTAAMGKGFVKDANIKALGLWSTANKHAMDAYRHLFYWLINSEGGRLFPDYRLKLLETGWRI